MSETRKILIEMEVSTTVGGANSVAVLKHPDLHGSLQMTSSSKNMLDLQLDHLDKNYKKQGSGDPISVLIESTNRLIEGFSDLKELVAKK